MASSAEEEAETIRAEDEDSGDSVVGILVTGRLCELVIWSLGDFSMEL